MKGRGNWKQNTIYTSLSVSCLCTCTKVKLCVLLVLQATPSWSGNGITRIKTLNPIANCECWGSELPVQKKNCTFGTLVRGQLISKWINGDWIEVSLRVFFIQNSNSLKMNICDRICKRGPYPTFWNAHVSETHISITVCTIKPKCAWFIEEALLQQQRRNEVLEPHCERVMGQSSRHFDSSEMFGNWH